MKKLLSSLLLVLAFMPFASQAQIKASTDVKIDEISACDSLIWIDNNTYTADTNVFFEKDDTLHVLLLTVHHSFTASENINETCSYTWNGTTYTSNGTYTDTLKTVDRCDSIVTITLTLSKVKNDTLNKVTACAYYLWYGDSLTTSGNFSHIETDETGCEITTVLPLEITSVATRTDSVSACGRYEWYGFPFTESIDTTITVESAVCDSVLTLVLDIYVINDTLDSIAACEKYKWNLSGETYTESGWKMTTKTSSTGCITNTHLYLTIDTPEAVSSDTVIEGCTRIRYKFADIPAFYVYSDSSASRTFSHNSGYTRYCVDSTSNIRFIVKAVQRHVEDILACDTFTWNGTLYTSNARDSIRIGYASNNCDSFDVVNLTIATSPAITAIEGRWRLPNIGESTTLEAFCDQENVSYEWNYWKTSNPNPQIATGKTVTIDNITENTDVRLVVTNNESECFADSWLTILVGVGISDVESTKVNLFPNPTSRKLNIESEYAIDEVSIYNMVGQQVLNTRNLNSKDMIDLSGLSNGTYSLRIKLQNGDNVNRKIVISK